MGAALGAIALLLAGAVMGAALVRSLPLLPSADLKDVAIIVLGLLGLPLAVWRAWSADRTSKAQLTAALAAQRSSEASLKQAEESTLKNRVDRHLKAVELLAEANAPIHKRVFAVVTLKELSEIEPVLRKSTFRVLNTFVRSELRVIPKKIKETVEEVQKQSIKDAPARREDIASILEILRFGYGEAVELPERVDLTMSNLYAANLSAGKFEGCSFFRSILARAKLSDSNLRNANLGRAFAQETNFRRCNLQNANMDHGEFEKSDFQGANLNGASLNEAYLTGANFTGASLVGANLSRAKLHMVDFREADISGTTFEGTWMTRHHLPRATDEQYAHIIRSGARFMDRDGNEIDPNDENAWGKFWPEEFLG